MKWKHSSSHLEASMFFTTESERQTDRKNLNSLKKATLATKDENSLSVVGKMKNIVV